MQENGETGSVASSSTATAARLRPPPHRRPLSPTLPAGLQPPLPPHRSIVRPRRRLLQHRSCPLSLGLPSVSRGDRRRRVPAVVLLFPSRRPPPAASISLPERRSTSPPPPSAPRRRPHPRYHLLLARTSPEHRRPRRPHLPPRRHLLRLPGRRARASADVAVSSLGDAASPSTPACPRFRRNVAANLYIRLAGVVRPPVPPRRVPVGHLHHHLRHRSRDVVLGLAAAPSPSVSPPFRGESTGDASSPASSGVATTSPPPAASATSPERRPTSPPPSSAPRRRSHPRHHLLLARTSPERRRLRAGLSFLLVGSSPRCTTTITNVVAACSTLSPPPLSRCCLPSSSSPIVLVIDVPSVARLVVSRRRLRHRHRSGVSHVVLVSVQPLPAVLVASSPVPVVAVVVVLSSFPVVVAFVPPSSRSRPSSAFVKRAAAAPSSSPPSAPRRQAPCRPRLAFVQGSPPKPSPRRSSPLCPSVSAAPVRRCRSHASSRGGL
ncbi:uncharacterized protein [Oryza sativa Japonica Group]|uniref:uncharacterized protein n=1 Tax=Oryza sativa subsp. japonica TaxID=39947 RepID=UPI00339BF27C